MKKKDYINILIISILCLIIITLVTGFTNLFGSDTDWVNQHTVFPEYFRNQFYETGKLIPNFTFNYGGGQNIYNISYYGYLSPVILLSYLLPFISMTNYIIIANIVIVLLSIFLFYKWLNHNCENSKICFITTSFFAFSAAFIFHMHRHIMFVNYMPFLIMSLIGVDKLLEKNQKSFFVLSVFLMIMTSYYFSISGIAVIGCYFIYKYLKINKKFKSKDFVKELSKIVVLGILAVSLSAILILPTFHVLTSGRANDGVSFNILKLFLPNFRTHLVLDNTYGVGYSLIALASALYLFFTKKKECIFLGLILILIIFFPISRYILNAGFYLKEKCLIPFSLLSGLSISIFIRDLFDNKINIKKFSVLILIIGIFLLIVNKFNARYFYMPILALLLIYYSKYKNSKIVSILLIIVAFVTCIINNLTNDFVSYETYNEYFNEEYKDKINNIIKNDSSYYRISNLMYPIKNVNKIYNLKQYTTSFYTSSYNNYYLDFVRNEFRVNNPDFNYFFISSSDNVLFNTFMGVKYVYSPYDIGINYDEIADNIYVNNNAFPIIYHSNNLISNDNYHKLSYPDNVIALLENTVVDKNLDTKYESKVNKINLEYTIEDLNDNLEIHRLENSIRISSKEDSKFRIKLKEELTNKILFINFKNLIKNKCSVGNSYIKINNITNLLTCKTWEYPNKNDIFHYVISGEKLENIIVEISKGEYEISDIEVYAIDYTEIDFNKTVPFNITSTGDTIKGNIEVMNDGYLVTSIPYDDGFTIKVNNKEYKPEKVNNAFIGLKLNKGNYEIEFVYEAKLLKEGEYISFISFIVFGIIYIVELKNSRKKS